MEPFYRAFYNLKSFISDLKIEVVLDNFIAEKDGFNDGIIDEIYANDSYPTVERYDVRINGMYHRIFLDELVTTFNEFNWEIKNNLKTDPLRESIPSYLEKLTEELTKWFDNIIEHEVKLNSQTKWFYIPKNVDQSFLKSEGVDKSIIDSISCIFIFLKHQIIEILENIEKFENTDSEKKEIDVPEDMFSNVVSPISTPGALDIYQTALLFHYLKKYKSIHPLPDNSLATIVNALTNHSLQNIRTIHGFGAIALIIADKTKNQNFKDTPNYNLNTLKDFLQKIIIEIDKEAAKNYSV
jgi:hypothetical protein